ncbi:MAG: hypothetical protein FWG71_02595 [Synergistaceae bacterium]|nr:hypothetical protein [Synergistaceae bacterium]
MQVNQNLDQNQVGQGRIGDVRQIPDARLLHGIRSGTLVEGQVLSRGADGNYMVRVSAQGGQPQTLLARATVNLIVGEHFRAVWDSSGPDKVPVLRLSEAELSFLSKLPAGDREMATALLARGMPLSDEVMQTVRESWRRMGGKPAQLGPILELWARGLPMTPGNAQIISWYMGLNGEAASSIWAHIRRNLKERSRKGENPVDVLRGMKEGKNPGEEEIARFLQGHSMLLRAPRSDTDPALLGAPLWPAGDDAPHITARVFLGRVQETDDRGYWQVGFEVEGSRLGFVGGDVESDGRSYILNLYAEQLATCELLKQKRYAVRKELEGISLALQFIGISQIESETTRRRFLHGRGLDITV